jgi:hypothetical protein
VIGRTENGAETALELVLLPINQDGRTRIRALGLLAPLAPPYWLGEDPIVDMEL